MDWSAELNTHAEAACPEEHRAWFASGVAAAQQGLVPKVLAAYAGIGRRFGAELAGLQAMPANQLNSEPWDPSRWTKEDLGRVTLLVTTLDALPEEAHLSLLEDLYFRGSLEEKRALLLSLPLLPNRRRFLELAVEACRTNSVNVFEAIACENPYPQAEFSELHFNQMILKTMFLALDAHRVLGVAGRVTPTLVRMVKDFESERRAAGRPVPEGIPWIVGMATGQS